MCTPLRGHEALQIDVRPIHGRAALTFDDEVIWLSRDDLERLRHKLVFVSRTWHSTRLPSRRTRPH